jgi:AmmeMemoRadiSam system protein B
MMRDQKNIRPSAIAGQWYPGDADRLAATVDEYMDAAHLPGIDGAVVGVMAPHAGYLYSGPVAGYAFAALRGMAPDVVVVLSPMHYPYYEELLTSSHDVYTTPLGDIPVHHEALRALDGYLMKELGLQLTAVSRDSEHSLEIELPFLQRALGKPFSLIPIMVRKQSVEVAFGLGKALSRLILESETLADQSVILVASTDLSHFYPQPVAKKLDAEVLQRVEAFDPEGVILAEDEGKGFACGRGALATMLWTAKGLGADHAKVLNHATSGDISGDYDRVVGYGAAVVTRKN